MEVLTTYDVLLKILPFAIGLVVTMIFSGIELNVLWEIGGVFKTGFTKDGNRILAMTSFIISLVTSMWQAFIVSLYNPEFDGIFFALLILAIWIIHALLYLMKGLATKGLKLNNMPKCTFSNLIFLPNLAVYLITLLFTAFPNL